MVPSKNAAVLSWRSHTESHAAITEQLLSHATLCVTSNFKQGHFFDKTMVFSFMK
jgi:hypothetical protein